MEVFDFIFVVVVLINYFVRIGIRVYVCVYVIFMWFKVGWEF